MIHIPADNIHDLSYEEALGLFNMSMEEWLESVAHPQDWLKKKPKGRGR